ncbi:hypothetical protein CN692_04540 [Bacillus sp. AFS002410]|uniref:CDP-glycerol glycerophosphotransferase family protein n=1 Tax=Bacillus sp. AFS002410 TaxID=2033481 RepID=UPI000BEF4581|nr:CDP-glycerol glycerophosphotransferase family protein [Bacillus sp. AFS002410]PEJ59469.1 hypothetical protein CN692_04540 [Bacillus sp. AFS002410]
MESIYVEKYTFIDNTIILRIMNPIQSLNEMKLILVDSEQKFQQSLPIGIKQIDFIYELTINLNELNFSKDFKYQCKLYLTDSNSIFYQLLFNQKSRNDRFTYSSSDESRSILYLNEDNQLSLLHGPTYDLTRQFNEIHNFKFNTQFEISSFSIKKDSFHLKLLENHLLKREHVTFFLRERNSSIYYDLPYQLLENNEIQMNLIPFGMDFINVISRWDLYIEFQTDNLIIEGKLVWLDKMVESNSERYLPYLNFEGISEVSQNEGGLVNSNIITPYLTLKQEIAIVIRPLQFLFNEKYKSRISVLDLKLNNSNINIRMNLEILEPVDYTIKEIRLKLRNKAIESEYSIPISSKKEINNINEIMFSFDFTNFDFIPFYWDLFVIVTINNEDVYIKLKNPVPELKYAINKNILRYETVLQDQYMIYPYVAGDNAVAFCYRERADYETAPYKRKEKLAYFTYKLFKPFFDKKDIWLGYEKFSSTAQDNGYYFFDYCYKQNKHKNFYYIIKEDAADIVNLEDKKDKVLKFMSFKYMLYMYAAKLLVSSESKGHSYDIRIQKGHLKIALDQKRFVFLQHGVTALKRVDYVFKKTKQNAVDLFVATSDYEKNIIKDYFGYDEDEIIVTGFCRWDVLQDKSVPEEKEIFLMPTWRSWMDGIPEEEFVQSDYFKNYVDLLTSSKLKQLLEEYNVTLNFFLHPKFMEHLHHFKATNDKINIYQFGEIKVNEFLMKSSMLITDYSSVAWEMYYQKKPTLFFQFDIDKYTKFQGSYLDMEKELFGERSLTVQDLIVQIEKYIKRDFKEEEKYAEMRKKYFKYIDQNNCERTFNEINDKKEYLYSKNKNKTLYIRLRENVILKEIYRKGKSNRLTSKVFIKTKNALQKD